VDVYGAVKFGGKYLLGDLITAATYDVEFDSGANPTAAGSL